jgi:hypothetical protein
MQSQKEIKNTDFYSFRADANVLGGFLELPTPKAIPTLAPVSLPAVGGFTTARSEGFTLDNLVSCRTAYSHVAGQILESRVADQKPEGGIAISSTAVVEDVNLLDVVRAERIVTRLSIWIPRIDGGFGPLKVSTAGTHFEGLHVGGRQRRPKPNEALLQLMGLAEKTPPKEQPNKDQPKKNQAKENPPKKDPLADPKGAPTGATRDDARTIGAEQAIHVNKAFEGHYNAAWVASRTQWMSNETRAGCSLVEGFEDQRCGHVLEIPGFGRIFLAELFITSNSAQLVGLRAELGCPVKGKISICCSGGGGVHD